MDMETLFELKKVDFFYQLDMQKVHALRNLNLQIRNGEFVCLCGPSGSGKSTLLNILGLIDNHHSGDVIFKGLNLKNLQEVERNRLRRFDLSFIFQTFHLIPVLTAFENVEFFLQRQAIPKSERHERVKTALTRVGLWEHRFKKPLELSGGQRQRVAIARALAKHPKVIIADEPTASVDQKTAHDLMELLKELNRTEQVTIVLASHDPSIINMAPRVIKLVDGEVAEDRCL